MEEIATGNFDTTSFGLIVIPNPVPVTPTPLEVCDEDGDGFAEFNLIDKDLEIIGGEPNIILTYHEVLLDAQVGVFLLISPYTNITIHSQILYARVESVATACYAIVELELRVLDGCPIIDTAPTDLFIDEGDNDGSAIFDLTLNETQMLGSQDSTIYLFDYHETFENSIDGVNAIVNPTAYQNILNPQTIYVCLTNSDNGSYVLTSFLIETDGVLGVDENKFEDLKLYPNPVVDNMTLQSQFLISESTVTVFNLIGKKTLSETIIPLSGKITLNVTSLVSGVYFMKVSSNENTTIKRFIKK